MIKKMKCPTCGGNFVAQNEGYYVCDHCGNISEGAGSNLNEQDISALDNANYRRDQYDFEEALSLCQKVLERNPFDAEANRCALLAQNKIVYLKNDEGKYVATFLDPETVTPITQSVYYRNLPERIKREMDEVEKERRIVCEDYKKAKKYDVFLCYKRKEIGQSDVETPEAEWAEKCYKNLTRKNYEVFWDKQSLRKGHAGWEAEIFAALKSAKIMIVFCSSLDHVKSSWVMNEWNRYHYLIMNGGQGRIKTVCPWNLLPPDKLPEELRRLQVENVNEGDWESEILQTVEKACANQSDIESGLLQGYNKLKHGKFGKARRIFNDILQKDQLNSKAYWGLLRCRYKAFDSFDLVKSKRDIGKTNEFKSACKYAADEERAKYEKIRADQSKRSIQEYTRNNYENYRSRTKRLRVFKKVLAVFCVLLVAAAGVFGYWEYSHPLKYSVENGQATLSGTSFFFRLGTPEDLIVEKYNEYPIVAIGRGALRNGNFKTVKLAQSVKKIGEDAFAGNNHLTSANCLSSTIAIEANAFSDCTNLSSISFGAVAPETTDGLSAVTYKPSGSVSIGEGAFKNCISLETVTINGLTYLGANAFHGCTNLKEVYIDSGLDLQISTGAFDSVSDALVVHIPTVEEELYNSLVLEYANITFEVYTRNRVEEVCYFIDKIDEISINSLSAIEKAEQLYNMLSPEERGQVTNYGALRDARAIYMTVVAINRIGTVTLQNEADIKAAEDAFNALNEMQKERVSNRDTLVDARAVFDTMKRISEIGSVSLQSKSAIESAETAYGELTEKQKGMVSNYSVLREARDVYDVSLAIDYINRIGAVNENSGPLIEQAEQAYNGLSPALRTRVTNYGLLQEARQIYNVIAAIAKLNIITIDSMSAITYAENLYYALSEVQRSTVTNYALLESARKIYAVVEMIESIDIITINSDIAIRQVESAFEALGLDLQKRVGNAYAIADFVEVYNVVQLIQAINSYTSMSKAAKAYEGLSASQRELVGNYDSLLAAEEKFRPFKVSFDSNGGSVISAKEVEQGKSIELPSPKKDGYLFNYWKTSDGTRVTSPYKPTKDITLYADWKADGDDVNFVTGYGTAEKPYRIKTPQHFINIKLYPNAYFVLTANIDLSEIAYNPIATFGGNLNGGGHSISNANVRIEATDSSVSAGLFGTNKGTIKNLTIRNSQFVASPSFKNTNINVYCGSIAGINQGTIESCYVYDTTVIANSSNLADKFKSKYNEDPREIVQGSKNWKTWIHQDFATDTSKWVDNLLMCVYAGGIAGSNAGRISYCSFTGNVESNLYNMQVCADNKVQTCLAGGIAGYNSSTVEQVTVSADVCAWIELDDDAGGRGWVGDTYPKGICYACGLVGKNASGTVTGQANGTQKANYRIFAPSYWMFSTGYNDPTKGHNNNLTIGTSATYC